MLTEHDLPEPRPLAYGVRSTARAASVSDRTLRNATTRGSLKARKLGRKVVLLREDLVAGLESLPLGPSSTPGER